MNIDLEGISPVVGIILLLGITVTIGGVIGFFVIATDTPETAPVVNLSVDVKEDINLYHRGGDTIGNAPSTLSIKLNGKNIPRHNINLVGGGQ